MLNVVSVISKNIIIEIRGHLQRDCWTSVPPKFALIPVGMQLFGGHAEKWKLYIHGERIGDDLNNIEAYTYFLDINKQHVQEKNGEGHILLTIYTSRMHVTVSEIDLSSYSSFIRLHICPHRDKWIAQNVFGE